jgi:hypothetical protein
MLQYIESERPFTIFDFGCGPGRDLKAFAQLATGLEGAAHLAAMAPAHSGREVWQQDFLKLDQSRTSAFRPRGNAQRHTALGVLS